jgi:ELWxxDGT repeat protein
MRPLPQRDRFKKSILFTFIFYFFLLFNGHAQLLLKDINTSGNSNPKKFIELSGVIYFAASTTAQGEELWRSDGTAAGTYLLKDINVGAAPSNIDEMTVMNGKLYFIATDGGTTYGRELWETDGTALGTVAINVNPGTASSNPKYLRVMNNWLYFAGTSGAANGEELYKTDGTLLNTFLVHDIQSGASSSSPKYLTVYNNEIYFSANDGSTGAELWKSDGTSPGTIQVSDIQPGSNGSSPTNFCVANNILFFSANDGTNGEELYKTTGTGVTLFDLNSTGNSSPTELYGFNSVLYFAAYDQASGFQKLWTSDGTTPSLHPSGVKSPEDFMGWNGKLYFNGEGELRMLNGVTLETVNINPSGDSNPHSFAVYSNRLFFIANNGNGNEIWITNGTTTGTKLAMDVNKNPSTSSNVAELTSAAGKLFFKAEGAADGSEVRFIGDCDPARPGTTMTMVKDPGLHYSLFETLDADGWSHYCDCTNSILLSLKKGGTGAVIPTDSVSIKIGAATPVFYFPNCGGDCFITNQDGSVIFNRSWDVQPTTQPTSEVPVRFYFSDVEYNNVDAELFDIFAVNLTGPDQMSFFKVTDQALGAHPAIEDIKQGDAITLIHSGAAPPEPTTTNWKHSYFMGTDHCSEFKVTSFSGGGGGAGVGGSPLPVELMYFWARPIIPDNSVRLEWGTASEINNYGFYIERSADLENWQMIGFQPASETGTSPAIYKYLDQNPLSGDNYYRLRQRDFDGTEEFSKITHITMDMFILGDIFPNPVSLNAIVQLDVTAPGESEATIEVFNLSRQLLQKQQVSLSRGAQFIPLDLHGLPAGMYVIKMESQGLVINTRLLIQD